VSDPALSDAELRSIEAYQARRAQFNPHWRRTIGFLFIPGMVLVVIGGGSLEALKTGQDGRIIPWLLFLGMALFLAGMVHGVVLMTRYLRCPGCERMQKPGWQFPYRRCKQCGARLSVGLKDSR